MFRWESVYILRFLKHGILFCDRNFIKKMEEITSILCNKNNIVLTVNELYKLSQFIFIF